MTLAIVSMITSLVLPIISHYLNNKSKRYEQELSDFYWQCTLVAGFLGGVKASVPELGNYRMGIPINDFLKDQEGSEYLNQYVEKGRQLLKYYRFVMGEVTTVQSEISDPETGAKLQDFKTATEDHYQELIDAEQKSESDMATVAMITNAMGDQMESAYRELWKVSKQYYSKPGKIGSMKNKALGGIRRASS